jgi:hypothetical protein
VKKPIKVVIMGIIVFIVLAGASTFFSIDPEELKRLSPKTQVDLMIFDYNSKDNLDDYVGSFDDYKDMRIYTNNEGLSTFGFVIDSKTYEILLHVDQELIGKDSRDVFGEINLEDEIKYLKTHPENADWYKFHLTNPDIDISTDNQLTYLKYHKDLIFGTSSFYKVE